MAERNENEPEGRGVLGDLEKGRAMPDSPVPSHEMPNTNIRSKAGNVAEAIGKHGDEFPDGGVMRR
jgi:hypothetical protein